MVHRRLLPAAPGMQLLEGGEKQRVLIRSYEAKGMTTTYSFMPTLISITNSLQSIQGYSPINN